MIIRRLSLSVRRQSPERGRPEGSDGWRNIPRERSSAREPRQHRTDFKCDQTLERYVSRFVSILATSPCLTNSGALMTRPVSRVTECDPPEVVLSLILRQLRLPADRSSVAARLRSPYLRNKESTEELTGWRCLRML